MARARRGAAGTGFDGDVVAGGPAEHRPPALSSNRRLTAAPLAAAAVVLLGIGVFIGVALGRDGGSSPALPTAATFVAPAAATSASAPPVPPASAAPAVTEADAIKRFMETDPTFIATALRGLNFGGREYCGVDFVGRSTGGDEVYAEASCQEYYNEGGQLAHGTGSMQPIAFHVLGSGAHTRVVAWQTPLASDYDASIRRMLPPDVARQIAALEGGLARVRPLWLDEPAARAAADLAAGTLPSPAR
jgi:hypothetical protein